MKALSSLAAIGAVCAVLLAGTQAYTRGAIQANRDAHAWRIAFDLTGSEFPTAGLEWSSEELELPNGFVLRRSSVNGYAGAIDLLAAFRPDAHGTETLAGVRVTGHRETPGLGDFIDTARSPWILQFGARRPERVDAVTGATVTSEAVKRGVLALLQTARSQPSSDVFRFEPVEPGPFDERHENGSSGDGSVAVPDKRLEAGQ